MCNLNDADLELLIYLDALDLFTKQDFKTGTYSYSWDNRRWNKLLKDGWIDIYKVSFKCKQLISRMYRIMLGEEEIPTSQSNKIMNRVSYSDKVLAKSIENVNKDKKISYGSI
jgi:hypothetical protein